MGYNSHCYFLYGCNVCRVIHFGPASDMELYLQETGRAGKDGLPSFAVLRMYVYTVDLDSVIDPLQVLECSQ